MEGRVARSEGVARKGSPRALVSGCPMAVPNWKVPALVEQAGAVIVGEESCIGARGSRVVSSAMEHNAVARPLAALRARGVAQGGYFLTVTPWEEVEPRLFRLGPGQPEVQDEPAATASLTALLSAWDAAAPEHRKVGMSAETEEWSDG